MKHILLILFLICFVSIDARAGERSRHGKTKDQNAATSQTGAPGFADYLIAPYDGWTNYWFGSDCTEAAYNWVSQAGQLDSLSYCGNGDYWDCDQSTTGITSSALPSALINKGVKSKSLTGGWRNASGTIPALADNTDMHIRLILKWATYSDEFYQWDASGASNVRAFTNGSGVITLYFTDSGASAYAPTSFFTMTANQWYLIDIWYDAQQGGNNYPRARVFIDGADVSPAEHTANQVGFAANGAIDLLTSNTCPNGGARGVTLLFFGIRQNRTISLEDHQRDNSALGL